MSKLFFFRSSFFLLSFGFILPAFAQEVSTSTDTPVTPVVTSTSVELPQGIAPFQAEDEHIGPGGVMTPDMKRTIRDKERDYKSILRMWKGKNDEAIDREIAEIKTVLDEANGASYDEWLAIDWDDLQHKIDHVRQTIDGMNKAKEMKGRIRGIEQGLASLEKMMAKLNRQKIATPSELTEKIAHVKSVLNTVKTASTMEEMEKAGWEDMLDEVRELDDSRQTMQMLSQFPKMAKKMDLEIKKLEQAVKKNQRLVSSLKTKGFDLTDKETAFEQAIGKLKQTRDEVKQKVANGGGEEAFQMMEDDFFGQVDETWQSGRVIETIANISGFAYGLKQKIAQAEQQINKLSKQGLDTSELRAKLTDIKEKGSAITNLIKEKDSDEIEEAVDELEETFVDFENAVDELVGNSSNRPWESNGTKPMSVEYKNANLFFTRAIASFQPATLFLAKP